MGRPFKKEIEHLNSTYKYVISSDVGIIENFIYSLNEKPLLLIGSGGSYSAAKAVEFLYQKSGMGRIAKSITPFELTDHHTSLKNVGVALLTAGGNNPDTVNSCKLITKLDPFSFLIVCMNDRSKVRRFCEEKNSALFFGRSLPSGKDGFLAVNSLIATILFAAKAFSNVFPNNRFYRLEEQFDFLHNDKADNDKVQAVLEKKDIIVLHGGLTTSVAADIESKFSEAALGSVHLADYRNFAHGRHYWLKTNINCTSVVALISPYESNISYKTLAQIPDEIPIHIMQTKKNNVMGLLELFKLSFHLAADAGNYHFIDPGKPDVPDFGKKLYHISHNNLSSVRALDKIENRAAYKKCKSMDSDAFAIYKKHFLKFYRKLCEKQFDGVVLDYDGTVKEKVQDIKTEERIYDYINNFISNGIRVAFASGRGKSIRIELQNKINKEYWDKVPIAYYNGGEIAFLGDNGSPKTDTPINASLQSICGILHNQFGDLLEIDLRSKQLTIMTRNIMSDVLFGLIYEQCIQFSDIKALRSGHSIDIVPKESSKLNLIDYLEGEYIFIGDSGQIGGNDYEMLSAGFGISVKNVSSSLDTCWNFAPNGISGTKAVLYYFDKIDIVKKGKFEFKTTE